MSLTDLVKKYISLYRERLANVSRRNKELYYKESRGHAVNLTKKPSVEDCYAEMIEKRFQPIRSKSASLKELVANLNIDINQLFLLDETHNGDLIKRIDKIRITDNKFQREYGISGAWLLGPFICWRGEINFNIEDVFISPIFKLAIDIEKNKKQNFILNFENNDLTINPSLRIALKSKWGIEIPEAIEADTIGEALDMVINIIEMSGKKIFEHDSEMVPKIPPRFKFVRDVDGNIVGKEQVKLEEELSVNDLELYKKVTNTEFILLDVFYLDHLNASRAVLFNDYDSISNSNKLHPILSELFSGKAIEIKLIYSWSV